MLPIIPTSGLVSRIFSTSILLVLPNFEISYYLPQLICSKCLWLIPRKILKTLFAHQTKTKTWFEFYIFQIKFFIKFPMKFIWVVGCWWRFRIAFKIEHSIPFCVDYVNLLIYFWMSIIIKSYLTLSSPALSLSYSVFE